MPRQSELTQQLLEVDDNFSNNPDPALYKRRLQLQSELDLLYTNQAVAQI